MLVLSRKRGEKIVIGDRVLVVTILDVRGSTVRLGFEADTAIPILRGELVSPLLDGRHDDRTIEPEE